MRLVQAIALDDPNDKVRTPWPPVCLPKTVPTAALRTRRRAGGVVVARALRAGEAKVFGGASPLTGTGSLDWLLLVSLQRCF